MMSTRRARFRKLLQTLLPFLIGFLCLGLLDLAADAPPPALRELGRPYRGRLVIFMVDSLDQRDVTQERMPRLARRIARGALHGPVRACVDALTVPCVSAMLRGSDRASSF